jgi:hypothetical protein
VKLRVFAQQDVPRLATSDWANAAKRFFATTIEVTERSADSAVLSVDGTACRVAGRSREEQDLRDALAADGGGGLYDLAERRCGVVWLVESDDERAALTLAAAMATVCLGPILADGALFGVRTAREKLAAL